jgi:hypothetical protein
MVRLFLSGPYSDSPQARVLEAAAVQVRLMRLGLNVFCPHTAYHWLNLVHPLSYEEIMDQCLAEIDRSNIVYRWSADRSPGADREVAHAHVTGIPVVYSIPELLMVKRIYFDRAVA